MKKIDRLISAFKNEDTASLPDPDSDSRKDEIVSDLEEYSADPRVLDFFLEAAADVAEYDLARIEVFNALNVRPIRGDLELIRIGSVIAKVLLNEDDDDEVRNYAAIAAASYMASREVAEAVRTIVLDPHSDGDLRANAFDAIERNGKTSESIEVVKKLIHDGQFRPTAARVLEDWGVKR